MQTMPKIGSHLVQDSTPFFQAGPDSPDFGKNMNYAINAQNNPKPSDRHIMAELNKNSDYK